MIVLVNKPYGMLTQFTDREGRATLADIIDLPDVYPAGRLDRDSEGLVVLTDDAALQHKLSAPGSLGKQYVIAVEGRPRVSQVKALQAGPKLNDGPSRPCQVSVLAGKPGWMWRRQPALRPRAGKPVHWLAVTLFEGRNRQLRRMSAAVGLPTLRLIRTRVGEYELGQLQPGQSRLEKG